MDCRIDDGTFNSAIKFIELHLNTQKGDILLFVPGLMEIKKLRALILSKYSNMGERIIEVHSAYSEDLVKRLFNKKVTGKIIIATNMGESSITLP